MINLIQEKAYKFALRIVRLAAYLNNEKREFVLSKKILDSGVNVSLFVEEAQQGENRQDFIHKYAVANKEAVKTELLLRLLRDTEHISISQSESLIADCSELHALLVSSLKTAKGNL
jgi:four helix bundle protein